MPTSAESDQARRYLFIVARSRPDLLARAQERFGSHPHVEIIVDRRSAERRRERVPAAVERRGADRRSAARPAIDGRMRPTVLVRRHRPTYAELQQHVDALTHQAGVMRAERDRLRHEVQSLNAALLALSAAAAIRATSHRLAQITHFIDSER